MSYEIEMDDTIGQNHIIEERDDYVEDLREELDEDEDYEILY